MIKQKELMAMLERMKPQSWTESDFRKMADGRIVRFTNWNRKAAR